MFKDALWISENVSIPLFCMQCFDSFEYLPVFHDAKFYILSLFSNRFFVLILN